MASELYDCIIHDIDGLTVSINLRVTGATDWPPQEGPVTALIMLTEAAKEAQSSPLRFLGRDLYSDEQWRVDHVLGIISDVTLGPDQGLDEDWEDEDWDDEDEEGDDEDVDEDSAANHRFDYTITVTDPSWVQGLEDVAFMSYACELRGELKDPGVLKPADVLTPEELALAGLASPQD